MSGLAFAVSSYSHFGPPRQVWEEERKRLAEDFDKEVDGFEPREFVVVGVDAHAKEEPGVSSVDDLVVPVLRAEPCRWCQRRGDERDRERERVLRLPLQSCSGISDRAVRSTCALLLVSDSFRPPRTGHRTLRGESCLAGSAHTEGGREGGRVSGESHGLKGERGGAGEYLHEYESEHDALCKGSPSKGRLGDALHSAQLSEVGFIP